MSEVGKQLHDKLSRVICDDLSKFVDTVEPGLRDDKELAMNNPKLVQENRNAIEFTWDSNFAKLNIIRELISAIREM